MAKDKVQVIIEARDKFSGVFKSFTSGLAPIGKAVGVAGAAIGGYTALIVANTKAVAENYDSVQKFSDRIGISTEALSSYQYIAERSGISTRQLRMGFQRMTRRIAEASIGVGVAGDALDRLGISIHEIQGLKPDEQFEILARELVKVEDTGMRAALAMKFFDSEGVALLQTLTGGVEGLQALSKEAEFFGIVISSQAGQNAAAFNDSLTRIQASFQGLRNHLAEQTMPALTALANWFAIFVAENRPRIISFFEDATLSTLKFAEYVGYAVTIMMDSWHGLKMIWEVLKIVFLELSQTLTEGIDYITEKFIQMLEVVNIRGVFDGAIEKARAFTEHNKEAIGVMEEMIQTSFDNLDQLSSEGLATERLSEFVEMAKEKFAELREEGGLAAALGVTEEDIEQIVANNQKLLDSTIKTGTDISTEHKKLASSEVTTKKKKEADKHKIMTDFTVRGFNLTKIANLKETVMNTYAAAQGAYKALAGIPIIGPALAVAAAAAATAFGVAQQTGISSMVLSGVAHGGLTNVPNEGTYLLNRGERVIAPDQNRDLTEALQSGLGSPVVIERLNISVAENAINADNLLAMDQDDWQEIVTENIFPALNSLAGLGFKTS